MRWWHSLNTAKYTQRPINTDFCQHKSLCALSNRIIISPRSSWLWTVPFIEDNRLNNQAQLLFGHIAFPIVVFDDQFIRTYSVMASRAHKSTQDSSTTLNNTITCLNCKHTCSGCLQFGIIIRNLNTDNSKWLWHVIHTKFYTANYNRYKTPSRNKRWRLML